MYNKDNIFAKIIEGKVPSEKIYEDEKLIVINDARPVAPVHVLIIPKKGYTDFHEFINNSQPEDIVHYYRTISKVAIELGVKDYRLVTNKGSGAGQSVFHFHTHLISGGKFSGLIDKGL